jgi:hypothetical protein
LKLATEADGLPRLFRSAFLNSNYSATRFFDKKTPLATTEDFLHLQTFLKARFLQLSTKNSIIVIFMTCWKSAMTHYRVG